MTDLTEEEKTDALASIEVLYRHAEQASHITANLGGHFERARTYILNSTPVPQGWSVHRHGKAILVDGGPGIGAMLEPENKQARLDTLYQFLDAWLANAQPEPGYDENWRD